MIIRFSLALTVALTAGCGSVNADDMNGTTPFLPGGEWRVHDSTRPLPTVVTPAAPSAAEFAAPPSDAIVLFDGSDLSAWETQGEDTPLWPVVDGVLMTNASGDVAAEGAKFAGIRTKESYGDVQLHLEFRIPEYETERTSQQYGNSGVYFMEKYEVQVLNSYENPTYADGSAASLYGWKPPLVNASRPPGQWQSYDIVFEAPEFSDEGELLEPAYITMFHNGVLVHNRQELLGPAVWRQVAKYEPHADKLPFALQHHSETVHYRNIWLRPLP